VADGEDGEPDFFRLNPIAGDTPPELSTGDPRDDQLWRQIAARVSLDHPRDRIHYDGSEVAIHEDEYLQRTADPGS
jgi:hypothetical protein